MSVHPKDIALDYLHAIWMAGFFAGHRAGMRRIVADEVVDPKSVSPYFRPERAVDEEE